ncbi:MAG: SH3 domain-containing protein [Chloroflexi bacterium]|nr:SH3 domain-containing protein [Chloroflexota bacterium]
MLQHKPFVFAIPGIMLVIALACNLPGAVPATQTPENIDPLLAAQLTIAAATSQNQTPGAENTSPSFTPTETLTLAPTLTFTPAFTLTPAFTSTPSFPYVTLSVATNCRKGPGKNFDLIDTFNPGQTIEVLGKNPTNEYWYVRSPNNQTIFCWLWGFYATGGNLGNAAVFTPPPSPTSVPGYEATYAGVDSCVGWWVEVTLKNIGAVGFKSFSISVKDTVTDITLSSSSNEFINNDGCLVSNSISKLDPEETYTVSSPAFIADPTGHVIKATLTLCTDNNLGGQCSVKNIEFKP